MRKVTAGKVLLIYNCDVLHLKFMPSLVEFKERVLNSAGSTTINNF